jgi:beta-lactam-binding protein with PASTA domain
VGRVTRVFSAKARAGRVIAQRPGKGKIRPRGTRMQLVVSKGRRSG